MSDYEYSFEKFGDAVQYLAASADPLPKRLERAFDSINRVRPRDVPDDLRDRFEEIKLRVSRGVPRNREGINVATANQLIEKDAIAIASDIVSFDRDLFHWRIQDAGKK